MSSSSKPPLVQRILPPGKFRSQLRHHTLSALAGLSTRATRQALKKNRVQNLYFHFLPDSETDNFRELIRRLSEDHYFLSYSEAIMRIKSGEIDKPYLSISFDDGFESNRLAAEILAEEGISACFFVCPDMVGKERHVLEREFSGDLGSESRMMSWDEIDSIIALGHEVGSHTLDHSVLADLSLESAHEQIANSKKILESKLGSIKHFAWPRGQFHHFRPELIDMVFEAGYESCASAVRGSHLGQMKSQAGCIRRENCLTSWPINHILYLLGRSTRVSSSLAGGWPLHWGRS